MTQFDSRPCTSSQFIPSNIWEEHIHALTQTANIWSQNANTPEDVVKAVTAKTFFSLLATRLDALQSHTTHTTHTTLLKSCTKTARSQHIPITLHIQDPQTLKSILELHHLMENWPDTQDQNNIIKNVCLATIETLDRHHKTHTPSRHLSNVCTRIVIWLKNWVQSLQNSHTNLQDTTKTA